MKSDNSSQKNSLFTVVEFNFSEHKSKLVEEKLKPCYGNLGKYLLFSDDKAELYKAGEAICKAFNLSTLLISESPSSNDMFSYVAKIYHYNDELKHLIEMFVSTNDFKVLYRYFKKRI